MLNEEIDYHTRHGTLSLWEDKEGLELILKSKTFQVSFEIKIADMEIKKFPSHSRSIHGHGKLHILKKIKKKRVQKRPQYRMIRPLK